MIFEQIPDARLMFVFTQNDPLNCAITAELKFHALRFMQAVETVMSHLDDPRCLGDFFDNLGKIHARQEERVGFKKVLARKNGILRQFVRFISCANCFSVTLYLRWTLNPLVRGGRGEVNCLPGVENAAGIWGLPE
ncbi:unnamed protein product [Toxocara canis]|uniref:GLOBIN domain-containing protein n=1 Tax=Toxocara canis TaxID=6265 RepID=A0A183VCZ8_TOXCA|nr:unnamed protein product [Toxocara canis]